MDNYWSLGKWGGVPVSMHWTVLLAFPFLYLMFDSFIAAAVGMVAFLFLLGVHELGHVLVARRRKVYVEEIKLFFLHGETALGLRRTPADECWIAWGGVLAQLVVLAVALAISAALPGLDGGIGGLVVGAILVVLTRWNVFLIIVALLPIGPMDGRAAWRVFALLRQRRRTTRKSGGEDDLTPTQKRELEIKSRKAAEQIIAQLGKKKR